DRGGAGGTRSIGPVEAREQLGVGRCRQALRHDHSPGVEDELAQLRRVDRGQTYLEPVVAEVGRPRPLELVGERLEKGFALLSRKREAHQRLVAPEGEVEKTDDSELY